MPAETQWESKANAAASRFDSCFLVLHWPRLSMRQRGGNHERYSPCPGFCCPCCCLWTAVGLRLLGGDAHSIADAYSIANAYSIADAHSIADDG